MRERVSRWPVTLLLLCVVGSFSANIVRAQQAEETAEADSGEVAALIAAAEAEEVVDTSVPTLRFYGFMDAGLQRAWGDLFDTGLSQSDALNFVIGNVNLYMDIAPSPQWRGLVEVRLTTFPNGTETLNPSTGQFTQHDTTILDYTSTSGGFLNVQWGSIILERAHIDWEPRDEIKFRLGYFLTPYGIWNVDHGTPTRIMLTPPIFVSYGLLPERQLGLDLYGTYNFAPWALEYHLYVSNGRSPSVDYTDDKALGGRLVLRTRKPFSMQLGASMFYGKTTSVQKSIGMTNGMLGVVRNTSVAFEELAGGADISIDVGSLRVRSELVLNRTIYEPGKRALFAGVQRANNLTYDAYLMFAYQLPWLGLEPLIYAEIIHIPTPGIAPDFAGVSAGINAYITSNVIVRTQAGRAQSFSNTDSNARSLGLNYAAFRLVITF